MTLKKRRRRAATASSLHKRELQAVQATELYYHMMSSKTDQEMLQVVPSISRDNILVSPEAIRINGRNEVKDSRSSKQSDCNLGDIDVLDLERMTDKFETRFQVKTRTFMNAGEMNSYLQKQEDDYDQIRRTDILLQRSYDLLFQRGIEKYPVLKKRTEAMIVRLECRPHLYCPFKRVETTDEHVTRWLNNHTHNPTPELHGFTSRDPYEIKRVIPKVSPRVSNSDTNIVLGKRKRDVDSDEDGGQVLKSSSEARLVCNEWYRPAKLRRRS